MGTYAYLNRFYVSLTFSLVFFLCSFLLKCVQYLDGHFWLLQRLCDCDRPSYSCFHLHCRRRTAVSRDCSAFPQSSFPFFHSSLICCFPASISPSISPHLCLHLLCWSAYHLLWDGDLIGHFQLVSLIANNCETRGSRWNSPSCRFAYCCQRSDRQTDQSETTCPLQWT